MEIVHFIFETNFGLFFTSMAFSPREDYLTTMVEYMENHPDFAKGRLSVANSRIKFRELWQELANKLNSLGHGTRPVEKWQKTWTDYKTNSKKKAAEIKKHLEGTGGGPELKKKLCDLEQRVLSLMGSTSYMGCGVQEYGLQDVKTSNKANAPTTYSESVSDKSETIYICPVPSTSKSVKRPLTNEETPEHDHDYLVHPPNVTPKRRKLKKDDNINAIYKQTIDSLKSIEETIGAKLDAVKEAIVYGFENLNSTLQGLKNN